VAAVSSLGRAFESLRHRDFALFWTSAVISNTGSWMQQVTVPFVIFDLTGSTAWLGISATVSFLPPFFVGPLAGAIADRYPRRTVLLVTQTVQMVAAFALWGIWISGQATLGSILAALFVSAVASGINITSWQAFVPSLVPEASLVNAVRLNSIQFTAARAIGPAIAGLVLSRFGAGTTFLVNAVTFLFVIAALLAVQPRPAPGRVSQSSVVREFRQGLGYLRRHTGARQCVMTVAIIALLPTAIVQLAPAIAREQFDAGDTGYGLLVSAYGVGSIVASLAVAFHADRFVRSRLTLVALLTAAGGAALLAVATPLAVGMLALFVVGTSQTVVSITQNTTVQLQVDDRYRGRVLAVYLMMLFIGVPIGTFLLGAVVNATSIRGASVATAVILVAYVGFAVARLDSMRALDAESFHDADTHAELTYQPTV
jgi:MFS family permease